MSIKVKVGGTKNVRIVAAGEKRPVIVPDSITLGVDTVGNYISRIDGGAGIIVFPEDNIETANIVISHAITTTEVSSNNNVLTFPRNIDLDQFGHVTGFYNTSLNPLNFYANSSLISAQDITFGNTSLTLGESTNELQGLELVTSNNVVATTLDVTKINNTANTFIDFSDLILSNVLEPVAPRDVVNKAWLDLELSRIETTLKVFEDPVLPTDAANKRYVDNLLQGLRVRPSALAATTENLDAVFESGNTTFAATLTFTPRTYLYVDDVTGWEVGSNLLVKDQTNPSQNGSYDLIQEGDANTEWIFQRSYWSNESSEVPGSYEFVTDGTVNGGTGWVVTVVDASTFTIDTDAVNWIQFQGEGTYIGGDGIDITGTTFSVNVDDSSIEIFNDTLRVKDAGITNAKLENSSITFGLTNVSLGSSSDVIEGLIRLDVGQINGLNDRLVVDADDVVIIGTGGLVLPVGTTLERTSPAVQGTIRYNISDSQFEGYNGVAWAGLGGVIDVDQDTKIIAENSSGADNDELKFYAAGNLIATLSANTSEFTNDFVLSGNTVSITSEIISNLIPTDGSYTLGSSTNSWSAIYVDNIRGDNQVINLDASGAVNIPAGTTLERPSPSVAGAFRYNLSDDLFEGFDGINWFSIGGVIDGNQDTKITAEDSPGANNDELKFFTNGVQRFIIGNDEIVANVDIIIDTTGAITIPVGTTLQRPAPATGMIRFNESDNQFEGYNGLVWAGLGGVIDADQDTKITAENSSASDEDELKFFTRGTLAAKFDSANNAYFYGNIDVAGDVTIGGNIRIGDQDVDTVTVVADFTSNLVPDSNRVYDLGSDTKNWNKIYVDTIRSSDETVVIDTTGALKLPASTSLNRPTPVTGMVRFNTTDGQFEGYDGIAWSGLGGVIDVDQDTKITAETSPGADNDELNFFTGGSLAAKLVSNNNAYFYGDMNVDGNIDVTGNVTIGGNIRIGDQEIDTVNVVADFTSNLLPNADRTYNLGATGKNWNKIFVDTIDSDDEVVVFDITGAVQLPSANTGLRPTGVAGMLRFNSEDQRFEGYDGTQWAGLAGSVIDLDRNTYIIAETSAGANNNELDFYTDNVHRMQIGSTGTLKFGSNLDKLIIYYNTGEIVVNGKVSSEGTLILDSNNYISASNNVIGDVSDPVNQQDVVTLNYLQNTFTAPLTIKDSANTYTNAIDLVDNPTLQLGSGLDVEEVDTGNNTFSFGLTTTGVQAGIYGQDGYAPRFRVNADGRIDFATDIPIELQANAIPDFTETSRDIIGLMFTDGVHEGIVVINDDNNDRINLLAKNWDLTLTGDISGTAEVTRLGNTTITTTIDVDYLASIETTANSGIIINYTPGPAANASISIDFDEFDNFYLPITGGTLSGNILAPRFVDSNNPIYYMDPAGTSRINSVQVGYNLTFSQIQMADGPGSSSYIYASGGKIGFLDNTFNYAAYSERSTGDWVVQNGDVKAERFVDADAPTYLLHPGGTGTYLHSVQVQNTLQGGNISINTNTISSTSGNIIFNATTNLIDVSSNRIQSLADPVNAQDAATKAYVDAVAQGLRVIPSALAATTADLGATYDNVAGTLTIAPTALLDIDGVTTWLLGDRLLVKDQTNPEENGSYELTTIGDALISWVFTRGEYFNESSEIPGAFQFVTDGTLNNGTGWVATVVDAETFAIGTDDVIWYQFSGAGTYTAGTGLTLSGTEFSITSPQFTLIGEAGANTDISLGGTLIIEGTDGVNTTISAGKVSIAVDELDGGTF
jgi:hypothetical protein